MFNQVKALTESVVRQQDLLLSTPIDLSQGEDSRLYGVDGSIDSLTLVSIIVDVEEKLRSQLGVDVAAPGAIRVFFTLQRIDRFHQLRKWLWHRAHAPAFEDHRPCRPLEKGPLVARPAVIDGLVERWQRHRPRGSQ